MVREGMSREEKGKRMEDEMRRHLVSEKEKDDWAERDIWFTSKIVAKHLRHIDGIILL